MKLNLRLPTLVLAGAWNPAIFSVQWMAKHILGKKEGDLLNVAHVVDAAAGVSSFYFENIGINASIDRVNLYCNEWSSAAQLEDMAKKILELLPHTPVVGLGVNFCFVEEQPDTSIIDNFQTRESLNQIRKIMGQKIVTSMEIGPGVTLNLDRQYANDSATFNFNYHHAVANAAAAVEAVEGAIPRCFEDALKIMDDVYGLRAVEYLTHALSQKPKNQGEGEHDRSQDKNHGVSN